MMGKSVLYALNLCDTFFAPSRDYITTCGRASLAACSLEARSKYSRAPYFTTTRW